MLYSWLRLYVRVIPFVAVVCIGGAIYFGLSGESSDAGSWVGGALGCLVGFVVGWVALRAIENRRAGDVRDRSSQ